MRKNRILMCFVLIFSMIFTLCSCGEKNAENMQNTAKKLTVWGMESEKNMLTEMFNDFKSAVTDFTSDIEHIVTDTDDVVEKAIGDIENSADVYAVDHSDLEKLIKAGAIAEITGEYKENIQKNCVENAVNAVTYNGKIYGFPASAKTYVLYYDKSKLTDNDVKTLTAILEKGTGNKLGMDFDDEYLCAGLFLTAGCNLFGENGEDATACDYNSDNGVKTAEFVKSLKIQGVINIDEDEAKNQFKLGTLCAYIGESTQGEEIKSSLKDNYGVMKLPTVNITGEQKQLQSFAEYKIYVVNAKSGDIGNAMKLAQHLTSEQNQLKRYSNSGEIPVHSTAQSNSDIASDILSTATIEQLKYSTPKPKISQAQKFEDVFDDFMANCFDGNIGDDVKTKLTETVDKIIYK